MEEELLYCSDCMKRISRGYFIGPADEKGYFCIACSRSFCGECGFFDKHDDNYMCNQCWLAKAKGLISNERYVDAIWIFKKLGRSREVEDLKKLEMERRRRLRLEDSVVVPRKGGFVKKD